MVPVSTAVLQAVANVLISTLRTSAGAMWNRSRNALSVKRAAASWIAESSARPRKECLGSHGKTFR